jgi:hypothetical protein
VAFKFVLFCLRVELVISNNTTKTHLWTDPKIGPLCIPHYHRTLLTIEIDYHTSIWVKRNRVRRMVLCPSFELSQGSIIIL